MGITLGERYELRKLITPLAEGLLYDARDHALMRDVFLYIVDHKTGERIQIMEKIRHVSWVGGDRFFHILNAGSNEEIHYVVLASKQGTPFIQNIQAHPFTGEEILREVYAIGKNIYDAQSEDLLLSDVTAENLWFTEDRRLLVINTWSEAEPEKRGVAGLIQLMKQLGHFSLTDDHVQYTRTQLPFIFQTLPRDVKTKLAALWSSPNEDLQSLPQFLEYMEHMLDELHSSESTLSHSAQDLELHAPEPVIPPRIDPVEQAVEPAKSVNKRTADKMPDIEEEEDDSSGGMDLSMKLGLITLVVTGVIAIFMVWNFARLNQEAGVGDTTPPAIQDESLIDGMTGVDDDELTPNDTDLDEMTEPSGTAGDSEERIGENNESTSNIFVPEPAEVEEDTRLEDSEQANTDDLDENGQAETDERLEEIENRIGYSDGTIVQVPDLIGLDLEDAEALLLRVGLRYEYFIENSEEDSGTVFRQQPEGFVEAERGDRVTFWVSR